MIKYEVTINENGSEHWCKDGLLHRENDLPAVISPDGSKYWYIENKLHRDNDLPAVILADGRQYWYKEGKSHRDNGPAIIWHNGIKEYYLNDKKVLEEEVMGKKKYTIEDIKNMSVQELLDKLNS